MTAHELKTDPKPFSEVFDGRKTFDIRRDDRGFEVGDMLILRETILTGEEMKSGRELEYTGRISARTVTHIMRGPVYGLADGWVIMSISVAK